MNPRISAPALTASSIRSVRASLIFDTVHAEVTATTDRHQLPKKLVSAVFVRHVMHLLGRCRSATFTDSVCSFEDPLAPLSPLLSLQVSLVIIAPLFLLTLPFDVALFLVLAPYLLAPHRLVPGELRCIAVRQRMFQIAGKDAPAIVAIISQPRPLKLASGAVVFRPDDTQ